MILSPRQGLNLRPSDYKPVELIMLTNAYNAPTRMKSLPYTEILHPLFREESSLVDMFTLEILVIYLESLAMAHKDNKSLGEFQFITVKKIPKVCRI